jgi:high-affinity iron transporter
MAEFFQGLIVTLREGVEAAILVALMLAALERGGRRSLRSSVYAGLAAALAASIVGAALLQRVKLREGVFEGILYLATAAMVGSMLVWMGRQARSRRGQIEARIGKIGAAPASTPIWLGLFLFAFLTVFREGVETVIFLGALSFNSQGISTVGGGLCGIALAAAFAALFIRGSLRIDLRRFFRVTTVVLSLFVAQLVIHGIHELSEAEIIPSGPTLMAILGPIVRQNTLLIAGILIIPVLLLLIPGRQQPAPPAAEAESAALRRKRAAAAGRAQRGRLFAAVSGMVVILLLGFDTLVLSRPGELSPPESVSLASGAARVPQAQLADGKLHRYVAATAGKQVRFLLLRQRSGAVSSALDACLLCGDRGYAQEGEHVVCRNCAAEINIPTIGQPGGCNPIPLKSHIEAGEVVIAAADLAAGARHFH